jgi:hypothetical protein
MPRGVVLNIDTKPVGELFKTMRKNTVTQGVCKVDKASKDYRTSVTKRMLLAPDRGGRDYLLSLLSLKESSKIDVSISAQGNQGVSLFAVVGSGGLDFFHLGVCHYFPAQKLSSGCSKAWCVWRRACIKSCWHGDHGVNCNEECGEVSCYRDGTCDDLFKSRASRTKHCITYADAPDSPIPYQDTLESVGVGYRLESGLSGTRVFYDFKNNGKTLPFEGGVLRFTFDSGRVVGSPSFNDEPYEGLPKSCQ